MKPSFNKNNKYRYNKSFKTKKNYKKAIHNKPDFGEEKVVTNPLDNQEIDNNQIISGYFLNEKPYKEMVIQRVNNFLYGVLGFLVLFCLICYYFVSCKEVQLNQISRETLELNKLYKNKKVSLGYCAEVAEMSKEEFVKCLGQNVVSIFGFDSDEEFMEELANA